MLCYVFGWFLHRVEVGNIFVLVGSRVVRLNFGGGSAKMAWTGSGSNWGSRGGAFPF